MYFQLDYMVVEVINKKVKKLVKEVLEREIQEEGRKNYTMQKDSYTPNKRTNRVYRKG